MKSRLKRVIEDLRYKQIVKNQTEVADKLGYTKTYLSRLLNGHETITRSVAEKMETMFSVDADWLLSGEGQMFKSDSQNTDNSAVNESHTSYETSNDKKKNQPKDDASEEFINDLLLNLQFTNPELYQMISRILGIMEHANTNASRAIGVAEEANRTARTTAESNLILARAIESLSNTARLEGGGEYPKSAAS